MNRHVLVVQGMYAMGIVAWLGLWRIVNGYELMRRKIPLLWVPFVLANVVLLANLLLWSMNLSVAGVGVEEGLFNFLDSRTGNIVSATSSVLVIATIIYGVRRTTISKDFLRYVAVSFICFIGFSTPIVWIPTDTPEWLVLLRHYQTIPFTFGLFFAVGGIIVLLDSLGVELPEERKASAPQGQAPTMTLERSATGEEENTTRCLVCREPLKNGSTVRLSCNHALCRGCITTQLRTGYRSIQQHANALNYDKCPLCRAKIMTASHSGTIDDYVNGTLANLVIISIPGKGLGVKLGQDDLR